MERILTPLIAATTTAAGGASVLSADTPIEMGVFVAGIIAVCGAAYWLGQKVAELKQIAVRLETGQKRFEKIEERLEKIERKCETTCALNKTQRVEVSG